MNEKPTAAIIFRAKIASEKTTFGGVEKKLEALLMDTFVLDREIGTLEIPRQREGMNPPMIVSYWSSKSMELVTQRLERGHECAALLLMHTGCFRM